MAPAGRSVTDKAVAIVFPITAFVAAGFEHSIANMYLFPLAWLLGAPLSAASVAGNLIAVMVWFYGLKVTLSFNKEVSMNRTRANLLLGIALSIGVLGGCSTPVPPAAPEPAAPAVPDAPPRSGVPDQFQVPAGAAADTAVARPTTQPAVTSTALPEHMDPASAISRERSVFFAFDDSNVAPPYMPLVERHASYLTANPSLAARIEGHADERGGPEYNLALGQRRAEAVARALRLLGVAPNRVEAVSYGEERPSDKSRDEAAWARNRRADIGYPRR